MQYLRSRGVVWLLALLSAASLAAAAQTSGKGAIKGVVRTIEATGVVSVVPDVTITLANPKLLPSAQTTQSRDNGEFQFTGLADGEYQLKFERPGFQTVQTRAVVSGGQSKAVEIQLAVAAVTGDVTIKARGEVFDTTQSSNIGTVDEKVLRNAPLAGERFEDALPLIPGVVRGPDGLINIKGTRSSQTGLLVNSANVTDPVTGNYAFSLPVDAISSLELITNPYSAEYGKFEGGITSITTRQGSNKWKFEGQNFFPRYRFRNGTTNGVDAVLPRMTFSGPLSNHLNLLQSFEYRFERLRIRDLRNNEGVHDSQKNFRLQESFDSFTRLDAHLSSRHLLTGILSISPQNLQFDNLNTFNPQSASANFRRRGYFFALQETAFFSSGASLQSMFSMQQLEGHVFANAEGPMVLFPDLNSGAYFNKEDRRSARFEFSETITFPTYHGFGEHNLKSGVVIDYTRYHTTDINNKVIVQRENGTTSQIQSFFGSPFARRNNAELSGFFQDRWNVMRSFTLDLGIRLDRDGIAEENNIAPRVGYVWLPFKNSKTIVRGGVGIFYDKIPLLAGTFDQLQGRKVKFFPVGLSGGSPVVTKFFNTVRAGGLHAPYGLGINTEIDREITKRLLLRVVYEQRDGFRQLVVKPIAGNSLTPATIQLSNGGRQYYREGQITVRYNLKEKSQLYFSYVRSRATGNLNDLDTFFGNTAFPIIRPDERSRLPFDSPHRFLFWGEIFLPKDIIVSPVLEVHSGFPFSAVNGDLDFVGLRNAGMRFPTFESFDLKITKGFRFPFFGRKYKIRIGLQVFNLFNDFNPRDVQNNIDSPLFGNFFNNFGRAFRGKFIIGQ